MRFAWDDQKHRKNIEERGLGFEYAAGIFEGPTIEWIDDRMDYGEVRIRAIGEVEPDILHVVYTDRGDVRWIISARSASRKERKSWRQER
jgi:uncharacterized DUF497 family protein